MINTHTEKPPCYLWKSLSYNVESRHFLSFILIGMLLNFSMNVSCFFYLKKHKNSFVLKFSENSFPPNTSRMMVRRGSTFLRLTVKGGRDDTPGSACGVCVCFGTCHNQQRQFKYKIFNIHFREKQYIVLPLIKRIKITVYSFKETNYIV